MGALLAGAGYGDAGGFLGDGALTVERGDEKRETPRPLGDGGIHMEIDQSPNANEVGDFVCGFRSVGLLLACLGFPLGRRLVSKISGSRKNVKPETGWVADARIANIGAPT